MFVFDQRIVDATKWNFCILLTELIWNALLLEYIWYMMDDFFLPWHNRAGPVDYYYFYYHIKKMKPRTKKTILLIQLINHETLSSYTKLVNSS